MKKFKTIEERNKWFNALPAKEKRIEIAKDLILSIETNLFVTSGGYFSAFHIGRERQGKVVNVQEKIFEDPKTHKGAAICSGCAIAGIFYSRIKLGNQVMLPMNCSSGFNATDTVIHSNLKEIISNQQLGLMEAAYEVDKAYGNNWGNTSKNSIAAKEWGEKRWEKYDEDGDTAADKVMIDICQNIINNKGRFRV
jgi:hypothetical protein